MRKMRKPAAAADAADVLATTGRLAVVSLAESSSAITPALAAVSPNRDSGACTSAGAKPR